MTPRLLVFLLLLSPSAPAAAQESDSTGAALMRSVLAVEGKSHAGRNGAVKGMLDDLGLAYTTMPFDTILIGKTRRDTVAGENIIVRLGSGRGRIVVGAHYDAVPGSPGANDNGGGVAVLIELLRTLKAHEFRHSIDICFFDREEDGLIGSAFYVKRYDAAASHVAMINLDVEGTGSEVYVGPVGGGDDDRIMASVRAAEKLTGYTCVEDSAYPDSDQESFAAAKLENISISVVPAGDSKKLSRWAASGFRPFPTKEDVPEVLKVMHSPNDASRYVSPAALTMSYRFTRATLLAADAEKP
jgi:aminopeptidase YwaD